MLLTPPVQCLAFESGRQRLVLSLGSSVLFVQQRSSLRSHVHRLQLCDLACWLPASKGREIFSLVVAMRWIIQIASLFGLTIANDLCDGSCAEHVDLIKAFGEEDDVGSLRLLQVARIASSTLPKDEKSHLQVESNNSTASTAMTLPMSWLQETMRAATSGRTVPPLLILVGLALALGVLILLLLQRLDSQRNSNRRGMSGCSGEWSCLFSLRNVAP
eukprot:s159_g39.t1